MKHNKTLFHSNLFQSFIIIFKIISEIIFLNIKIYFCISRKKTEKHNSDFFFINLVELIISLYLYLFLIFSFFSVILIEFIGFIFIIFIYFYL